MRIAIVGGGWVGCHLALKLRQEHNIALFEKEDRLFSETSYNNQNRLHLGYHYPRNFKTRELCKTTFDAFMRDYGSHTSAVNRNYYCVANSSNIDFNTYKQIFDIQSESIDFGIANVEGSVNTNERCINHDSLADYFNSALSKMVVNSTITDLHSLSPDYDLVINCTNNALNQQPNSFFEGTITFVYEKLADCGFDAITLVDGNFFSLYPTHSFHGQVGQNLYTLTDVEHTPIGVFPKPINSVKISRLYAMEIRNLIEAKVMQYLPNFREQFNSIGHFTSVKAKNRNNSANRYPIISKQGNVISCYTGKIQGIYPIESEVRKIIDESGKP